MTYIKFYSMAFVFIMLSSCAKVADLGSLETSQTVALPNITQNVKNAGKLVAREKTNHLNLSWRWLMQTFPMETELISQWYPCQIG